MPPPPGPLARLQCAGRDVLATASADIGPDLPNSYCCRFCPRRGAHHVLASADEDGTIKLWDTRPAAATPLTASVAAHTNAIYELDWSSDGRHLLSAAGDRAIKLWDAARVTPLAEFRRHSRTVKTVTFLPEDPCVFASGGRDGVVEVWDLRVTKHVSHEIHPQRAHHTGKRGRGRASSVPTSVTSLLFRDDTYLLSASSGDSSVSVWDLRRHYSANSRQPLPLCRLTGTASDRGVTCMVADRQLSQLYVSTINEPIQRYSMISWTADTGGVFSGHTCGSFFVRCCLSADGAHLVSGSSDGHAYLWRPAAPGPPAARLADHGDEVTCVAYSADGRTLATLSDDLHLRLWRTGTVSEDREGAGARGDGPLQMDLLNGARGPPLARYTLCRETGVRWRPRAGGPSRVAVGASVPTARTTQRRGGRASRPAAASAASSAFLSSWLSGAARTPTRSSPRKRPPGRPVPPSGSATVTQAGGAPTSRCDVTTPVAPAASACARPAVSAGRKLTIATRSSPLKGAPNGASPESRAAPPRPSPRKALPTRTSPRKGASAAARSAPGARTPAQCGAATPASCVGSPRTPSRCSPRKKLFAATPPAGPSTCQLVGQCASGCVCGRLAADCGTPETPRGRRPHAPVDYRSPTADLPNWVADGVSPHRPVAARRPRQPRTDWLTCLSQKKRALSGPAAPPSGEKRPRRSARGARRPAK